MFCNTDGDLRPTLLVSLCSLLFVYVVLLMKFDVDVV